MSEQTTRESEIKRERERQPENDLRQSERAATSEKERDQRVPKCVCKRERGNE